MPSSPAIPNLYTQGSIHADFKEYLRLEDLACQAETSSPEVYADRQLELDQFEATAKTRLASQIYATLEAAAGDPLPPLCIHACGQQADAQEERLAQAVFADSDGVHVGLDFMRSFEAAVFVLTLYLYDNFMFQIAPPMGDVPPPDQVVAVDDFPSEALSLYAAHLIPEAESRDGYHKRPFQVLMEYLQTARFHDPQDQSQKPLARFMPKPPLDLVNFSNNFEADRITADYGHAVKGPYLQRLHLQLLLDGLFFILAHEAAHFRLGHLQRKQVDIAGLRAYEAAADLEALQSLAKVPGFELRSLSIVFNYARFHESSAPAEVLDHPLARNRLLILYETILNQPGNQGLYADVNASLHLLQTQLEPYGLLFGWPDEEPEEVDIFLAHYSDMSYTAHLYVYIERVLRNPEREGPAWAENAFILAHLVYKITFALRDRIQPDQVYVRGMVAYHPKISGDGLFIGYQENLVYTRLHLPVPAPPEWFLEKPGSELVIEKIEIDTAEPIMPDDETEESPIYFYYEPTEFNLDAFLGALPPLVAQPEILPTLLIAARRYTNYQRYQEASAIYGWLYDQQPESLGYGDLMDYCVSLLMGERYDQVEPIATWALRDPRQVRPGFHNILAFCQREKGEIRAAFEHTFLEGFAVGVYGEFFDNAQELAVELLSNQQDPVMKHYRRFVKYRNQADQAFQQENDRKALAALQKGYQAIRKAQEHADKAYVFLHQIESEVSMEIYPLKWKGGNPAELEKIKAGFQKVLEINPYFTPAHIQLAKIALAEGNPEKARALWQAAYEIAPFNKFVFEFRDQVEEPNPDAYFTSQPAW